MIKYLLFFVSAISFSQQTKSVDFLSVDGKITLNTSDKTVSGAVTYSLNILEKIDTIKIDAVNMDFSKVQLNHEKINFISNGKQLLLINHFKKGKGEITFQYKTKPKQALYFVGSKAQDNLQIWTQGQGKYTSNWFPSFDDVTEKVIFNLGITFDSDYQVISNGVLESKTENNNLTYWQYQMKRPMSSYLLMLAIGKFQKKEYLSKSNIPLDLYIETKDSACFESTYRYSKQIFDFLEEEIGVNYPWEIYKQAPVREFLYAGMENTSATLFATTYVTDSIGFEDRSYTNVNAHELAHQWFGNLVTAESSKHHWLQEGFATYYALLAERKMYGDDYFYSKLYETASQLKFASRTDTIPLLNAKASSLTFYQKGAWTLFVLHEEMGDENFKKAVKNYLKKYAFQSVNTNDFFSEITKVSDFEIDKLKKKSIDEKKAYFKEVLESDTFQFTKIAIVNQLKNEKFNDKKDLLKVALNTNNLQVRQAVARTLTQIPEEFRTDYEMLLHDNSYQTQEIALYFLWNNFPSQRVKYLDLSQNWIGFNDYHLKTLWLSLSLSTQDYAKNPEKLVSELINYSSVKYEATTRQNALDKLLAFKIINKTVLSNLVNATTHHMWQFSKFGRDSIRILLKNSDMRFQFEEILPNLTTEEQFQLNRLLKE